MRLYRDFLPLKGEEMTTRNLLGGTKRTIAKGHVSAANSAQTTAIIDMQGFDSISFEILIGTLTSGQTLGTLQVQGGNVSNGSDMANLVGALITLADTTTGAAGGCTLEVVRPNYRYIQLVFTRNSQAAEILGIIALQSNVSKSWVQNDTTSWPQVVQAIEPLYSQTYYTTTTVTPTNDANASVVYTARNTS